MGYRFLLAIVPILCVLSVLMSEQFVGHAVKSYVCIKISIFLL